MGNLVVATVSIVLLVSGPDGFTESRERMVKHQIQARGVRDAQVLKAMRDTPRHLFVPEKLRSHAYEDTPLPIGFGQTISQPYIVAAMTELLDVEPGHRVLEIGTGSGYQAAVLSPLVREVFSMEIVEDLAKSAALTLRQTGCSNVSVRYGDGYKGWPEKAPFDRIILTAAPPEIPQALFDQLVPGGKLVAPVGSSPLNQELVVVDKGRDGKLKRRTVFPVRFVPMVTNN
ncbi:MAG: protein-L-isoaspartate(D-aspartate) O-methyltransferase [Bryobacteraceae bacterium]|nr:protein-L-isoaspartate(D-aspartate) O-methyltransferase [Bryobacterales bacterium]NUN02199.1 protein-L-isoaspartate(D-aspartate) O-methyltransferase [Bryobacteraceae bacterium]